MKRTERFSYDEAADELLRAAFEQEAVTEALTLEERLKNDELLAKKAEQMAAHHEKTALNVIRQNSKRGKGQLYRALSVAACLMLVIAGVRFVLRGAPTPADTMTSALTAEPLPTFSTVIIPAEWDGAYYPTWLPDGAVNAQVSDLASTGQQAAYRMAAGTVTFAEYFTSTLLDIPTNASITYQSMGGKTVMLVTDAEKRMALWDENGQTFALTVTGAEQDVERIVTSVRKLR